MVRRCIPIRRLVSQIEFKGPWRPCFPLSSAQNSCLERDCFVELNSVIEYWEGEIEDSLRYPSNHKGRLSDDAIRALISHLPSVDTLTEEQKEIITQD